MHLRPAGMGPGPPGLCEKAQGVGCAGAGAGAGGTGRGEIDPSRRTAGGIRSGFRCWSRDESRKGWRKSNETPSVHAGRRLLFGAGRRGFWFRPPSWLSCWKGRGWSRCAGSFQRMTSLGFGRSARCCCWARLFTRSTPTWAFRISPARASLLLPSPQIGSGQGGARTAVALFRWLPMLFFLFVAAQAYSPDEQDAEGDLRRILSWRWRKRTSIRCPNFRPGSQPRLPLFRPRFVRREQSCGR